MVYVTQEDLVARFGENELRARAPDGSGGIEGATVERACADAQGEIDSRLAAAGLATPLSPVPPVIVAMAADIARYRLYDDQVSETIKGRYDGAIRFMKAVASGDARLGPAPAGDAGSAGAVDFYPGRRVFGGGGF